MTHIIRVLQYVAVVGLITRAAVFSVRYELKLKKQLSIEYRT
jgi:hypothetical protein